MSTPKVARRKPRARRNPALEAPLELRGPAKRPPYYFTDVLADLKKTERRVAALRLALIGFVVAPTDALSGKRFETVTLLTDEIAERLSVACDFLDQIARRAS